MDVGSYALMTSSGLQHIDFLQACKFAEGDSRILSQKMARDLIQALMKGKQPQGMVGPGNSPNPAGVAPDRIAKEKQIIGELVEKLKPAGKDKKAFGKIWEAEWRTVYRLADCIQNRVITNWVGSDGRPKMWARVGRDVTLRGILIWWCDNDSMEKK